MNADFHRLRGYLRAISTLLNVKSARKTKETLIFTNHLEYASIHRTNLERP